MESKFLIVVLGSSKGVEDHLNNIASENSSVNYVDGNGIFIATFFSPFTAMEMKSFLVDLPAFLLFDITDGTTNAINLPSKYYRGLFPEVNEVLDVLNTEVNSPNKRKTDQGFIEEYDNVDDILDKLSRNNYNRDCLTKKEIKILENIK